MTIALRVALPEPLGLVAGRRERGTRTAVIEALPSGDTVTVSYDELRQLVEATAARMFAPRGMAVVAIDNTVAGVVRYLAALHAGHAVLVVDAERSHALPELADRRSPVFVWHADDTVTRCGSPRAVEPELGLVVSTSGSSGLVRISRSDLDANTETIATHLAISADALAALPLSLSDCHGLSVLHTLLTRGAGVLLSSRSTAEPAFWRDVRAAGATTLADLPDNFRLRLQPDPVRRPDDGIPAGRWRARRITTLLGIRSVRTASRTR